MISNSCLAGVHPQNSAFMTDLYFPRLCLAYEFTTLFSLLLKALYKKQNSKIMFHIRSLSNPDQSCTIPA